MSVLVCSEGKDWWKKARIIIISLRGSLRKIYLVIGRKTNMFMKLISKQTNLKKIRDHNRLIILIISFAKLRDYEIYQEMQVLNTEHLPTSLGDLRLAKMLIMCTTTAIRTTIGIRQITQELQVV